MTALAEHEPSAKQCHRCDKPVRMSLPEFQRDPQNWTTCKVCRDWLAIEVKEIGPLASARRREARINEESRKAGNQSVPALPEFPIETARLIPRETTEATHG